MNLLNKITTKKLLNQNLSFNLFNFPKKLYHPVRELMHKNVPKYFSNPNDICKTIIRIIYYMIK